MDGGSVSPAGKPVQEGSVQEIPLKTRSAVKILMGIPPLNAWLATGKSAPTPLTGVLVYRWRSRLSENVLFKGCLLL
jgi:hypothetical protein